MSSKTLDILVPVYNESTEVIEMLLDSIALQQNVDFDDVKVIFCSDGGANNLTGDVVNNYPFEIEYYFCEHKGVSATRNECLKRSSADYVMFCDADDMFFNACGLYIIFREMNSKDGFDTLISAFVEETRHPDTGEVIYVNHDQDATFVHGKVHNRRFLLDNNIRWNNDLTIHEDSYFNCLCQQLATVIKYCPTSFYLWKWRDDSVCRHDPKYILKTYSNMIDSNTALVKELKSRRKDTKATFFIVNMVYDAYFTMNKDEWLNQENQEYRDAVEKRFKKYYEEFEKDFNSITDDDRRLIIRGIKNRMFEEGLIMESITFDDWIKRIMGGE